MSKRPSFEEALRQKINDLPLPDENACWQKMTALLDEKEKRRKFFFFRNKLTGGALLLCGLLSGLGLFLQTKTKTTNPVIHKNGVAIETNKDEYPNRKNYENSNREITKQSYSDTALLPAGSSSSPSFSTFADNNLASGSKAIATIKNQDEKTEENLFTSQLNNHNVSNDKEQHTRLAVLKQKSNMAIQVKVPEQKQQTNFTDDSVQLPIPSNQVVTTFSANNDSNTLAIAGNNKTDSGFTSGSAKATIRIKHRSTYFIDAGIGIKQQVPIDSQRFVAYNYNATKSWFGDYIPFLYLTLEKENRWFVQGEFHYAAPRLINAVPYQQTSSVDYGHGTATVTTCYLQKVWYNEVPLSLNIYVRTSWSVGAGAMFSLFHGAAVRKTTSDYDVSSGQYISQEARMPWKGFTDSFLYKNNTSLMLQTNYKIRRWSIGIRYLHDLHPYLTYTLPDGEKRDKSNASLEMMIRYRLYRSAKFRIGNL